ncbi:MAG TPA: hypothetical protein DCM86_10835 [Verrucomicrobiales bacterium]|nr:hypothetical protein [Verrucomicrobiales bacterium]
MEGWLQGLAAWLLRPRQAALLALGLIVLGSIGGSLAATDAARTAARDRYLAAVDPLRPAP